MSMNMIEGASLAFGMPGPAEMLIVLAIVMVLFGGAKLPSLMRNLGRSANEFKRGMSETGDDDETVDHGKGSKF